MYVYIYIYMCVCVYVYIYIYMNKNAYNMLYIICIHILHMHTYLQHWLETRWAPAETSEPRY